MRVMGAMAGPPAAVRLLVVCSLVVLAAGCGGDGKRRGAGDPAAFELPGHGEVWRNVMGMEFVPVPPGEFLMGSTPEEVEQLRERFQDLGDDRVAREQPARRVRITRGFLIGKYEVTVGQYRAFVMDARYLTEAERVGGPAVYDQAEDWAEDPGASWMAPGFLQRNNHPVVCVTWNDAQAFIQWLNRMDGRKPEGWVYRLPTEAEWEYAARGTDGRQFPWGTEWKGQRANFSDKQSGLPWAETDHDDGFPRTAPVGAFSPDGDSPFGACDMAGNAWEWCEDAFAPDAYSHGAADDPLGERGDTKVERGGGWSFSREHCRTTYRFHLAPSKSYDNLGFRVVLAPAPPDTDF